MNRQNIRREIVADLDHLLQAAKAQAGPQEPTRGGISRSGSAGNYYYYNTNLKRRATIEEANKAWGLEDGKGADTRSRKQTEEAQEARSKLAKSSTLAKNAGQAVSRIDSAQKAVDGIKNEGRQAATQKMLDMDKAGIKENANLGKLLADRASYSKEAAEAVVAQATEALYTKYAGVHDYLADKTTREKFNQSATEAIGGLVGKAQTTMTTFAQTAMDGISSKIQSGLDAAKGGIEAVMKQPEMVVLSGQMMGAMHAIQSVASPATTAINKSIANMAFSVNMANAQLVGMATHLKDPKARGTVDALIANYQEQLQGIKNPTEADLENLREEFNQEFEKLQSSFVAQKQLEKEEAEEQEEERQAVEKRDRAINQKIRNPDAVEKQKQEMNTAMDKMYHKGAKTPIVFGTGSPKGSPQGKQAPDSYTV